MRTGVARSVLRKEVQIEASISTTAGHTTQHDERINHLLNRMQRRLASMYTWPILTGEQQVTVLADSATGTLPTNFPFSRILDVWVQFGSEWLPVQYGIGAVQRSIYGPTQRATPIQRWEITYPGTTNYEVWPIGSVDQVLRFTGERAVTEMALDSDTCLLDGDVLVAMCAAEILKVNDKERAADLMRQAETLAVNFANRQVARKNSPINLADEGYAPMGRPGIDYIAPIS